jgi:hypothetical protein
VLDADTSRWSQAFITTEDAEGKSWAASGLIFRIEARDSSNDAEGICLRGARHRVTFDGVRQVIDFITVAARRVAERPADHH